MTTKKHHLYFMVQLLYTPDAKIRFLQNLFIKQYMKEATGFFQKQDDGCYIVKIKDSEGTKEEVEEQEKDFWENGSIDHSKALEGINNSRLTPKPVKKMFSSLLSKSNKVSEVNIMFRTFLNILQTTHVLPANLSQESIEDYFQSCKVSLNND